MNYETVPRDLIDLKLNVTFPDCCSKTCKGLQKGVGYQALPQQKICF